MQKYPIILTREEEKSLHDVLKKGIHNAYQYRIALVILHSNEKDGEKHYKDKTLAELLFCSEKTIENIRKNFYHNRTLVLKPVKKEKSKQNAKRLNMDTEAEIVGFMYSNQRGQGKPWTLRSLAEALTKQGITSSISHESLRRILKKYTIKLNEIEY